VRIIESEVIGARTYSNGLDKVWPLSDLEIPSRLLPSGHTSPRSARDSPKFKVSFLIKPHAGLDERCHMTTDLDRLPSVLPIYLYVQQAPTTHLRSLLAHESGAGRS
jgi:hypothetical protein